MITIYFNAFSISRDPKIDSQILRGNIFLRQVIPLLWLDNPPKSRGRSSHCCYIYSEAGCSPLEAGSPTRELRAPSYCNYVILILRLMVNAHSRSGVRLRSEAPQLIYNIVISVVLMRLYNQELCAGSESSSIYSISTLRGELALAC